jgi:hypothetical protein
MALVTQISHSKSASELGQFAYRGRDPLAQATVPAPRSAVAAAATVEPITPNLHMTRAFALVGVLAPNINLLRHLICSSNRPQIEKLPQQRDERIRA